MWDNYPFLFFFFFEKQTHTQGSRTLLDKFEAFFENLLLLKGDRGEGCLCFFFAHGVCVEISMMYNFHTF